VTLAQMLGPGTVTRQDIGAHLDALDHDERIAECLDISKQQQKRLWEITSADPEEPQDLVAGNSSAVFAGRNTLPLFTRFEKRFARHQGALIGFNVHPLGWLTGPGYFTVASGPTGLIFDYNRVPDDGPNGWPRVRHNNRGFAKPVYGGLLDDTVWVARDVLTGSARRGGVSLDSYFVLART
jgi:hypothetical protein